MKDNGFLGIKKLIRTHKLCKYRSKEYRVKPVVRIEIDTDYYMISIIPTIYLQPWQFRRPNTSILDIHWLNIHICVGLWVLREKKEI